MALTLKVSAQGPIGRLADRNFEWIMRHVSGAPAEAPQRTHRWNNHHLKVSEVTHLSTGWMVTHQGEPSARKLPKMPVLAGALAHTTKYGGWKNFLVLQPYEGCGEHDWHIGWRWQGGAGVSRVIVRGPVRVLVGPNPTKWFGITTISNIQIPIIKIGTGRVGDGGPFCQIPLF